MPPAPASLRTALATLTAALAVLAAGCASVAQKRAAAPVGDPVQPVNRAMWAFNSKADDWVLRPAAVGWQTAVPAPLRQGIRNVLDNASSPVDIINAFLQGKPRQGGADTARFVVNTVIGLGGLFDPATEIGLRPHDEDFGQTLNTWGVPQGPFLMIPVFGPYTLTHAVGSLLDAPFSPFLSFQDPLPGLALYAVDQVDARGRFLDTDRELKEAFDSYAFVRDAYLQNRAYRIADGVLPQADFEDEEFGDDAFDGDAGPAATPDATGD
jgi:phospholipid-binding lipoprotein MlaA